MRAVLISCYTSTAGIGVVQLLRLNNRSWTTQKLLHALAAVGCMSRVTSLTTQGLALVVSDQLAILVFLTMFWCLAAFWAELSALAADRPFTAPVEALLCALYGVTVLHWALLPFVAFDPFPFVAAGLFVLAAGGLVYYGRSAATQLRKVPISLETRLAKITEIRLLTSSVAFFAAARAVTLIIVPDMYLVELAPVLLVLAAYRRIPRQPQSDEASLLPYGT